MVTGYTGKILNVDLTTGNIRDTDSPSEEVLRKYIGGFGLGIRLLYDMLPPGYSPLDADNPMIFLNGPLTGFHLPAANNLTLTTKNADTGFTAGRSHTHGFLGPKLKFAGYDGLIVTGASESPVYLWIQNGRAEIRDAKGLWSKDTHETESVVKQELEESGASVAAIGPAGENLCAGALIANDRNHSFAHSGVGTVMGSKKLKAIAIFGKEQKIPAAKGEKLGEIHKRWTELLDSPWSIKRVLGKGGIARNDYELIQKALGVSGCNWQKQFPDFGKGMSQQKITSRPCWSCPIGCAYDVEITSGPHKGHVATLSGGGEAPESVAGLLGITEPGTIFYLTDLYDRLGIEASTGGCTIAMAFEAYEKGLLTADDTDGLELKWGDAEVAEKLIRKYANREGFGDLLALGLKKAASMIGGEAPDFTIHVKGGGIPLHDWRPVWGKLLGVITSSSSGQAAHGADSSRAEPDAGYPERTFGQTRTGKAEEVLRTGPHKWYQDSIGVCWFATVSIEGMAELVAEAISAVTGWDYSREELLKAGERIGHMERAFNVRHGLTPEDDYDVPRRILEAPKDGPGKGKALGPYLRGMINEYYRLMGWDEKTGKPFRHILENCGLNDVARDLWG